MRPDPRRSLISSPRVILASGMHGTGVSTIVEHMQTATPLLAVIDGGAQWVDILEACTPGVTRIILVTTHDIVSVTATYALIKLLCDRFPGTPIEILINRSGARDALRTYERVQGAAMHFLRETVGYAGAIPESQEDDTTATKQTGLADTPIEHTVVLAIQDIARRLDDELFPTAASPHYTLVERS